jgi:NADPH:quinone reductase-like Zn-dependent oxidoreductase
LKFKLAGPGKVVGCDVAGIIVDAKDKSLIGKRVRSLYQFGLILQVAAVVHGGFEEGNGAYGEYVKAYKDLSIPLPDNMSFEAGATLPLASATAALVIFQKLEFPLPGSGTKDVPFLVWGGASSVGMYAIQFATLAGATVIATASKDNHELLKSLGAKYTFDYKDADVIEQIKKVSNGGVEFGIDCVSEAKTVAQASKAFVANGKIGLILPVDKSKSGDTLDHKNVLM